MRDGVAMVKSVARSCFLLTTILASLAGADSVTVETVGESISVSTDVGDLVQVSKSESFVERVAFSTVIYSGEFPPLLSPVDAQADITPAAQPPFLGQAGLLVKLCGARGGASVQWDEHGDLPPGWRWPLSASVVATLGASCFSVIPEIHIYYDVSGLDPDPEGTGIKQKHIHVLIYARNATLIDPQLDGGPGANPYTYFDSGSGGDWPNADAIGGSGGDGNDLEGTAGGGSRGDGPGSGGGCPGSGGGCPDSGGGCGLPRYWVNTARVQPVVEDTDFAYNGLGPPVSLTRTWNGGGGDGMFGHGWSFSHEARLEAHLWTGPCVVDCPASFPVTISKGSGQQLTFRTEIPFVAGVTHTFTPPAGVHDRLTAFFSPAESYFLYVEKATRLTYRFDTTAPAPDHEGQVDLDAPLGSVSDRNGHRLVSERNASGQLVALHDAVGRTTTFAYGANGRCSSLTVPGGATAHYYYGGTNNARLVRTVDLLGTEVTYTYGDLGAMTSLSADGRTSQFAYADLGVGRPVLTHVTDANGHVTTYTLEPVGQASVTVTRPSGAATVYTNTSGKLQAILSPLGLQTLIDYSADALPAKVTDPKGRTRHTTWDARGNLVTSTDEEGRVWTSTYDADDNLLSVTNPMGETWLFTYDPRGNRLTATSPAGLLRQRSYDPQGRPVKLTDPGGHETLLTYGAFGNLTTVTNPLGEATSLTYDAHGIELLVRTDARGHTTQYAYDADRRLVRETHPDGTFRTFAHSPCALTSVTDEMGHTTTLTRDAELAITAVTNPLGAASQMHYTVNGRLADTVNATGAVTALGYDVQDRVTSQTDPLGHVTTLLRDEDDTILSLTDPRGSTTAFLHDRSRIVTRTTDPMGKQQRFSLDAAGRVRETTNPSGSRVGVVADPDNRPTALTHDGASVATFAYGTSGDLGSMTDATGTTTFARDALHRLIGTTWSDGTSVTFGYDAAGNQTSVTYPGGPTLTATHDARDRVQTLSWGTGSITFTFDAASRLLSESRSNGTATDYGWDAAGRLTGITHRQGPTPFLALALTRDAAGRIVGEQRTGMLEGDLPPSEEQGLFTDPGDQVMAWSFQFFLYDDNGNVTTGLQGMTAQYDPANRPVTITRGGIPCLYTHDAAGHRVQRTCAGIVERFHYDAWGRLLFTTNATGTVNARYFYAGRRLVAMRDASGLDHFYHADPRGSTLALTSQTGATESTYSYDPYGRLLGQTGTVTNPFTFVGAWGVMDEGGNLYFMRHRYYDAVTGRFIQRDPIGFGGGQTNLYTYAGGDPASKVDPDGTCIMGLDCVVVLAGAAIIGGVYLWKDSLSDLIENSTRVLSNLGDIHRKPPSIAEYVDPSDPSYRGGASPGEELASSTLRTTRDAAVLLKDIYTSNMPTNAAEVRVQRLTQMLQDQVEGCHLSAP